MVWLTIQAARIRAWWEAPGGLSILEDAEQWVTADICLENRNVVQLMQAYIGERPEYSVGGTQTGRLSSSRPNYSNPPRSKT